LIYSLVIKEIDDILAEGDGQIEDLNLDNLEISKFTKNISARLEKLKDLNTLTLNECSIESLAGFPKLPALNRLEIFNNQFKGGEIKHLVDKIPKCKALFLGENEISEFEDIAPLSGLKELTHLDLSSTPLSEKDDYRTKIFALLPTLEILDEEDKDGNPVDLGEDDEDGDEGDQFEPEDDEEGDDDDDEYDEEDDDEEFDTKRKKGKK